MTSFSLPPEPADPSNRRAGGWGYYAYAEYPTGEVELYDMAADPAQLDNVAGRPEYAEVRQALAMKLVEFVSRPGYVG